jgi:NADH-quinone oxidoreductase subunit E
LDPQKSGPQTTADGKFTVEFVECLASCGTAPVLMVGDQLYQSITSEKADEIVGNCQ